MSCRSLLAVAVCVAVCAGLLVTRGSAAFEQAPKDATAQLKELQDKVAKLESRIADLEKRPSYVTVPTTSPSLHSVPSVPRNWQEREFNGMKFYIVPVDTKR
jgi:hypothetical protein